ncbi:MAG TPA: hypothetical protein VII85_00330 [Candidatus Krumholzibacteriaceae bacterium]
MAGTYTNICQGGASITVGTDLGFITGGVTLVTNADMYYAGCEGVTTDIHARVPKTTYEIKTTLLEPTMANLKIALDWSAASASSSGGNAQTFGTSGQFKPTERMVMIYGYVPGSGMFSRLIMLDRAIAVPGGDIVMANAEETKVPVVFHGLYSPPTSRVGMMIDALA